jgi:hypothetical protein
MDKSKVFRRRGRRRSMTFNPSHKFIEDSVDAYLKDGGKITKIERVNGNYQNFVSLPDSHVSVDDFLFDR